MSRKALTPREVDEIVGEIRARPFLIEEIAERHSVTVRTAERLAWARGVSTQRGGNA